MSNSNGNTIRQALNDVQRFYEGIDSLLTEWGRLAVQGSSLSRAKDSQHITRTGPDSRPPPRLVGMVLTTIGSSAVLAVVLPEDGEPTVCATRHPPSFKLTMPAWTKVFRHIRSATFVPPSDAAYEVICIEPLTVISSLQAINHRLAQPVIARFPKDA